MHANQQTRQQRAVGVGRLVTKSLGGRTRIAELYQEGAAKIRLPETFSDELEAVIINTAGGITGGDQFDWNFRAGPGCFLTATTQACEKIYKASAGTGQITTRIEVGPGAKMHWLPQESILFDNASLTRRLDVDLAEDAEFLAVEAILLGRKAMGEAMSRGLVRDRWRIRRDGQLLHAEDLKLEGDVAGLVAAPAVLAGRVAFATLILVSPRAEALIRPIREQIGEEMGGVSHWQGKLVARVSASDGFALRKILLPIISALRGGASVPKVWNL
ncbi:MULTISPECIES: urease accessory protein UreD [Rhizobiaceae]|uniref:Urease accessory protein UreD n=1 Tax=Peteryoungia algae TaxID=2919917 RepID=A0ABT0CZ08_9HYPH|nr:MULTISPECIES: urease accessory protein UreD [unclassified Rhizobium]MCC8932317.1 urease accessory protein UreD [Rhizobium sp. 'Codium 1']MCJ8238391.1 urease accessory protein UreD [Rhizobium sp. SSM4.3]